MVVTFKFNHWNHQKEVSMTVEMTLEEIESRFNSKWVLLEDPETNEQLHVTRGKVLWHSKNRDEVYQKALELRPKRSAFLYTGRLHDDTCVVV